MAPAFHCGWSFIPKANPQLAVGYSLSDETRKNFDQGIHKGKLRSEVKPVTSGYMTT